MNYSLVERIFDQFLSGNRKVLSIISRRYIYIYILVRVEQVAIRVTGFTLNATSCTIRCNVNGTLYRVSYLSH